MPVKNLVALLLLQLNALTRCMCQITLMTVCTFALGAAENSKVIKLHSHHPPPS